MREADVILVGYEEFENLGLRYIATYLEKMGVSTEIYRYDSMEKKPLLDFALKTTPKIIGLSMIFQRMLPDFAELVAFLRSNGINSHVTIGGHFPTADPAAVLEAIPGLDSVVRGEGEYTMLELWRKIDDANAWRGISGITFRENNKIINNEARPLIDNLDDLPFPKRDIEPASHRGLGVAAIIGSRGCYYDCSFCSVRKFYQDSPGPLRRSRSPANVVAEMRRMFDEHGTRVFIFEDDDFLAKNRQQKEWVKKFLSELSDSPLFGNILWRMSCRIDDADRDLLSQMKEAGLMCVYTGIESGNEQGLKTYNKRYKVKDIYNGLHVFRELSLPYEFGFMLLNPDSTLGSVKEDIEFLKKLNEDRNASVHFTKMMPYSGTPIANRLKNDGRLKGTVEAPDYEFEDQRLNWFQDFLSMAFHERNFNRNGVVEMIRYAKMDAMILEKFFPEDYDVDLYWDELRELIFRGNAVCLQKASMAVNFMMRLNEDKIMEHWDFLERLASEEKEEESRISNSLVDLMYRYGLSPES